MDATKDTRTREHHWLTWIGFANKTNINNNVSTYLGIFQKKCTDEELHQYLRLLDNLQPNNDKLGPFLAQLTNKYQIDYL